MKLHVLTPLFNPRQFVRVTSNYLRYARDLPLPMTTIEASFSGEFLTDATDGHIQIKADRDSQLMWQKERLQNIGLSQLPADVDVVAFVDADLVFLNSDLEGAIETAMRQYPVAQMFRGILSLNEDGQFFRRVWPGAAAAGTPVSAEAAPGGAWVWRREVLEQIGGLFDRNILGSGDSVMAHGVFGHRTGWLFEQTNIEWRQAMLDWIDRCDEVVQGRFGYVPGDCCHLYHGRQNASGETGRRYRDREFGLHERRFDPMNHIEVAENGLWQFSNQCPRPLAEWCHDYFSRRVDDD